MSNIITWYFIKFFESEQYADEFLGGRLFLNRLSHFKRSETASLDGRPDQNEAISMWFQPEGLNMTMTTADGENIDLGTITSPVSSSSRYHGNFHIFCLYTMQTTGFSFKGENIYLPAHNIAEFKKQITIDKRCFDFGPFAVVVKTTPFLPVLRTALIGTGWGFSAKRVGYYDEKTFSGEFLTDDIPFRKQKYFSYQNEFRVCIETKTTGSDPLTIEIGDISDICVKMNSADLNDMFEAELKYIQKIVPEAGEI
jgi:hypothetical protein